MLRKMTSMRSGRWVSYGRRRSNDRCLFLFAERNVDGMNVSAQIRKKVLGLTL
jgi:hypothetical protein